MLNIGINQLKLMMPQTIPSSFLDQFETRFDLLPFDAADANGNSTLALAARRNRFKLWFTLSDMETTYELSPFHNETILSLYSDFYHKFLKFVFDIHPLKVQGWIERGRGCALDEIRLIDSTVKAMIDELVPYEYFGQEELDLGILALEIVKTYATEIHPLVIGNPTDPL